MHVLFLQTVLPGVRFNSSIAALSAWVKSQGHEVSLIVVPEDAVISQVAEQARGLQPDVIALSYMSCVEELVNRLVPEVRSAVPNARLIAGGPHPTMYPKQTLAALDIDAVCVGEGEVPLTDWMADPKTSHPGILRKNGGDTLQRWWAPDVDALPDWDLGLFGDVHNAGNRYERATPIKLSRGFCIFTCTFCGVDGYRRANEHPKKGAMRLRSVDRVLDEIERATQIVNCEDGFAAWDEILPTSKTWLREFFPAYGKRIGLPLAVQARIEQINERTVEALVAGGCDYIVIGVECGDEAYRAKYLDKPFTNAQCIEAFRLLHGAGIETFCSFMLGLPFETPKMLADTVRLARRLEPTHLSWKYFTPERGTRLFGLLQQHELLIDKYVDHPFGADEPMIKLTHCSRADLDKAQAALLMLRGDGTAGTYERRP